MDAMDFVLWEVFPYEPTKPWRKVYEWKDAFEWDGYWNAMNGLMTRKYMEIGKHYQITMKPIID